MDNLRPVHRIVPSEKVNMGGILLDQPLPNAFTDYIDPFLLIHHWDSKLPAGRSQFDQGVGPHPHRGFSPVTFIFKGAVHHRDSRGNDSVVFSGGTQWMHAGMGITHSERPSKELAEEGGPFELIQFWVNVPSPVKMVPPSYHPLQEEETPFILLDGDLGKIWVVAGEINGIKGPIPTHSPLLALRMQLKAGANQRIFIPDDFNALIYVLDGEIKLTGEQTIKGKDMAWFTSAKGDVAIEVTQASRAILLAGKPIGEPVTTYGPFVMTTQTEILQALRDAQMGKMGILIEK